MALKRIRYVGPHPEVEIEWPIGGRSIVKRHGHLDVPTRMAAEMAKQTENWEIVAEPAPSPAKKDDVPVAPPAGKDA